MKLYVLLHDRDRENNYTRHYEELDKQLFTRMNAQGYGVYFTPNSFDATSEELRAAGLKTKRNKQFLTSLNYAFADLDIAKEGDGSSVIYREGMKDFLQCELINHCAPTSIIATKNGLQPLWRLTGVSTSEDDQAKYLAVENGIIEWSKQHGSAGDKVKDVTRILRMPGYNHMKGEPYPCEIVYESDLEYTLDKLLEKFPYEMPEIKNWIKPSGKNSDPAIEAVRNLDFKDVMIKALASVGRIAEFDRTGRLILDGKLTGNFQGKTGNKEFMASTSHEDLSGNKVTAVAKIRSCTNREAYQWILDEFDITKRLAEENAKRVLGDLNAPKPKKERGYFTWGTPRTLRKFAPIEDHTYAIIAGETESGKTAYCLHMALENAKLGHKVLYFTLEMTTQEMLQRIARNYADITIAEWIKLDPMSSQKQYMYEEKIRELETVDNLTILDPFGEDADMSWGAIRKIIEKSPVKYDMIFMDNFDCIEREGGMSENQADRVLNMNLKNFAKKYDAPMMVVAHLRKRSGDKTVGGRSLDAIMGTAKIQHSADKILFVDRDKEPDAANPAELILMLKKGRSFPGAIASVYHREGAFFDESAFEAKAIAKFGQRY